MPSTLPILDRFGAVLSRVVRGRPRAPQTVLVGDADPKDEYTARDGVYGYSTSDLNGINGTAEFVRLQGHVDDLDITVGWDAKEQMDRDAHCGAALDTVMLGAVARGASVEPAEKSCFQNDGDDARANEVAEFARRCLKYLLLSQRDLSMTGFALGRAAMKIGHANAEVIKRVQLGGVDDRKLVVDRIKLKSRKQSCFVVDRQNNVVGIAAYTGNYSDYVDPYSTSGGVNSAGFVNWNTLALIGWRILPRDKWLSMTFRPGEDDSPLGNSAYRRAWAPYRMKRDAWAMYLKALDKTAMPFLKIVMPQGAQRMYGPTPEGRPDVGRGLLEPAQAIYEWAVVSRQGGVLVLPFGATADYLHASMSGDPFAAAIGMFDDQITTGILLQTLATGTSKHMARAAGQVHQDILDLAMRYARHLVADSITRDVMGPLIRDNFPVEYWHLVPRCSFGDVELNDFAAWAEAFAKLAGAGLMHWSQFPHVWATLGLPQADGEELAKELGWDAQIMDNLAAPQVAADGTSGPSVIQQYSEQETGKRLTRNMAARRAGRQGIVQN